MNIVSYGGGANSTALLIGLHQHRIPVDLILFADTGAEHPHTYAYLDIMDEWLKEHGMPTIMPMMNKIIRRLGVVFLIAMCLASLSVTAYAYADDAGPEYILETTTPVTAPTEPAEEPTTGSIPLTPDGNMTLVDDIEGDSTEDKQFITVVSKNGNYFYIIIDRADDGENTVHFLNQVDEADLLALMEEGQAEVIPIVCSCTEKCQAGAVNTACKLCMTNMGECVGKVAEPMEPTEPEEPAQQTNKGAILALVLILAAGGGAACYFLVRKPKQAQRVPSNLDDFDLEDEEDFFTEEDHE